MLNLQDFHSPLTTPDMSLFVVDEGEAGDDTVDTAITGSVEGEHLTAVWDGDILAAFPHQGVVYHLYTTQQILTEDISVIRRENLRFYSILYSIRCLQFRNSR